MIIIYNDTIEGLKVLHSAMTNIDLKIIAEKDVPSGIFYKLISDDELPPRDTRNFWEMEINKDNCDGVGLTAKEFYKKYPQYKNWSVK
jgi:hypothetical protein